MLRPDVFVLFSLGTKVYATTVYLVLCSFANSADYCLSLQILPLSFARQGPKRLPRNGLEWCTFTSILSYYIRSALSFLNKCQLPDFGLWKIL